MRHLRMSLLAVMTVALLAVAACSGTSTPATSPSGTSTVTAKSAACNGLATLNQALNSSSNFNASTTVGEVKAAQAKVSSALNAIDALIPAASGELLGQIKSANDQLAAAIQNYPDSTPIGQTSANIQDLKTAVGNAQSKTTQLASALKCAP
jgi:hypothetical protein